jgi:hypothetical protein
VHQPVLAPADQRQVGQVGGAAVDPVVNSALGTLCSGSTTKRDPQGHRPGWATASAPWEPCSCPGSATVRPARRSAAADRGELTSGMPAARRLSDKSMRQAERGSDLNRGRLSDAAAVLDFAADQAAAVVAGAVPLSVALETARGRKREAKRPGPPCLGRERTGGSKLS